MPVVQIPVTKGKGTVEINTDDIPDHIFSALVLQGLKHFVNLKMSKVSIARLEGDKLEEAKAAAMYIANKNREDILAGKTKLPGVKASDGKVSGAVMTEARRMARNIIKDGLKRKGKRVSMFSAKLITEAANAYITQHPSIIADATASLAQRDAVEVTGIDLDAIPLDETKVAAAEAKKKKDQLSAAKAGKVAKHKPQARA